MAPLKSPARAGREREASTRRAEGPTELRGYRLHERVGQEELATVFRGTHTTLDRPVHVYLLRRTDWVSSSRFGLAARLAARLTHPHLLPVIDAGHDEKLGAYMVTPQIDGQRLDEALASGPLDPLLALRIFSQVGEAVDYLHRQAVVHRDIQPSNVRVSAEGMAFLTNMSLAAGPDTPDLSSVDEADYLTPYAAPEQTLRVAEAAASLDIYSLGAMLYHMLSGELPPDPQTPLPSLGKRDPALAAVDRVVARLMAAEPLRRYPSATVAAAALRQALRPLIDAATDDMEETRWEPCAEWLDNPLELVLGQLIDQGFLQATRARADRLHRAGTLRRLLNRWSRESWLRRRSLGSLMQPQEISSYNIYFYELRTAYETRTPPEPRTEPWTGGSPPLGGLTPDLWEVPAPSIEIFETVRSQELVLPNAQRLLPCPECNRGRVTCSSCNGTGEVPRPRRVLGRDGSSEMQELVETCPTCRGYRTQPCATCTGSGNLVEEQVFRWSRRAKLWQNTDDLEGLPEKVLSSQATTVFQGPIDPWESRWQGVEPLRELLAEATSEARESEAETRIIGAELTISGVPVTEIEYTLNERPQRLLVVGIDGEDAGAIHSDTGGYDIERAWLYGALVLLVIALTVAVFLLR